MSEARLHSLPERNAAFVEPMECLAVSKLPDGPQWLYEIKLDGYRALAVVSTGVTLLSRRKRPHAANRRLLATRAGTASLALLHEGLWPSNS
jgi:ATP-dependent DNA ligase